MAPLKIMAVAAGMAIGMWALPASAALKCKAAAIVANAPPQPSDSLGISLARQTWVAIVVSKHGKAWAEPAFGRNTKYSCKAQPSGVGFYVFRCVYSARPCKP